MHVAICKLRQCAVLAGLEQQELSNPRSVFMHKLFTII